MKKALCLFALSLLLLTGCERVVRDTYVIENQTDKDLTFYPANYYFTPYEKDTITIAPGEIFVIYQAVYNSKPNAYHPEYFYDNRPLFVEYDGVKYQIDRNDPENCFKAMNYWPPQQNYVTTSAYIKPDDFVWSFEMTEDYIKSQIVVE